MNVIITIDGKDYAMGIKEAKAICKSIHEQLYIPTKDK